MDVTTIEHAVTTLQQQGKPVSVRSVHRLTGGSFRDISRLLRTLHPSLLAGAQASTDAPQVAEVPPQPPRSPEQAQALEAYRLARQELADRVSPKPGRLPMDRTSILVPLQLKVERARQRLVALGILNPEQALQDHLRGG
jgi:hypothetical protein